MAAAPSTDWREQIAPDEDARFLGYAEFLRELQRRRGRKHGPIRALHRKPHVGVEARFEVRDDVPAEARAGLFAKPGSYAAYVRFSNGSGGFQADSKPDVRGVAIKVMGAPGKKLIPGLEAAKTQDFLLIQQASVAVRNAAEFVALVRALANPVLLLPRLFGAFGLRTFAVIRRARAGLGATPRSLAGRRFYSAAPIRWGDYAGKVALLPVGEPAVAERRSGRDYLRDDLAERIGRAPLEWDFAVQLFRDEKTTPIEDPSLEWTEEHAPFVPVARLVIPSQDVNGERGRALGELIEKLAFDPWHALVEHRPLGDMMRARNQAYRLSTEERGAAPEPEAPL